MITIHVNYWAKFGTFVNKVPFYFSCLLHGFREFCWTFDFYVREQTCFSMLSQNLIKVLSGVIMLIYLRIQLRSLKLDLDMWLRITFSWLQNKTKPEILLNFIVSNSGKIRWIVHFNDANHDLYFSQIITSTASAYWTIERHKS